MVNQDLITFNHFLNIHILHLHAHLVWNVRWCNKIIWLLINCRMFLLGVGFRRLSLGIIVLVGGVRLYWWGLRRGRMLYWILIVMRSRRWILGVRRLFEEYLLICESCYILDLIIFLFLDCIFVFLWTYLTFYEKMETLIQK